MVRRKPAGQHVLFANEFLERDGERLGDLRQERDRHAPAAHGCRWLRHLASALNYSVSTSRSASAGVTMAMPWKLLRVSRSLSPETMRSTLAAIASASTASSSGSRQTGSARGGGA